jgi:hypothetical protein
VLSCIACWGRNGPWRDLWIVHGYLFLAAVALVGLVLRWTALLLFDRGLGRVRDRPEPARVAPGKPRVAFEAEL